MTIRTIEAGAPDDAGVIGAERRQSDGAEDLYGDRDFADPCDALQCGCAGGRGQSEDEIDGPGLRELGEQMPPPDAVVDCRDEYESDGSGI